MSTVSISTTGAASTQLVWERYAKPALWSSWSPQISHVDCVDLVIRAGSTGRVYAVPGMLGIGVSFEVTEVDHDAMRWAWIVRLPLGRQLRLRHTVGAVTGGTRTGLEVTGFLPVVLGYLPLARLALGRLVEP